MIKISGFEKLTLTDFPGLVACIVFTQGCNLRCPFCQNSDLLSFKEDEYFSEDFIFDYLEKRKNMLDGVVISGGEPTLQKDLKIFIKRIKLLNLKVKLDTNGTNPELLKELIDNNLVDYVAMDIKNIMEDYFEISGIPKLDLNPIKKSIEILKSSNIDYEFRTTIVKEFHNLDKITKICEMIGKDSKYYLQNFQDSERVLKDGLHSFSSEELEQIKSKLKDYPNLWVRG